MQAEEPVPIQETITDNKRGYLRLDLPFLW